MAENQTCDAFAIDSDDTTTDYTTRHRHTQVREEWLHHSYYHNPHTAMSYVIAGRKVGAEWLSIATLTTFFSGVAYAMSGPSKTTVGTLLNQMLFPSRGIQRPLSSPQFRLGRWAGTNLRNRPVGAGQLKLTMHSRCGEDFILTDLHHREEEGRHATSRGQVVRRGVVHSVSRSPIHLPI